MKSIVSKSLFLSLFVLLVVFAGAQEIIVSVSDFTVESENIKFKYIGKGISTLVAGELRRTKTIKLLERSQMNKIMEEQKLSLSGMVDEAHQVELGKLMAADFIVFGEIIDMGNSLLISVRMADVTTTEVVWEDSLMEKLETYDYIGAYFAQSILTELKLDVQEETVAKVETKVVKETEAIVALSSGIDAYDKGDEEKAKEELKTVQMLDPENEVAEYYLSKLQAVSPKFRVELQEYSSTYSPASLGFIDTDKIYVWMGLPIDSALGIETVAGGSQVIGDYFAKDWQIDTRVGYSFPVGKKMGLAVGFVSGGLDHKVGLMNNSLDLTFGLDIVSGIQSFLMNLGGSLSIGARLADWVSIGTSVLVWNSTNGNDPGVSDTLLSNSDAIVREGLFFSIYPGIMFRDPNGNLTFDINAGYSNQRIYYADYDAGEIVLGFVPLVIDSSFTYGMLNQRLFLGLKGISDIYLDDRGGYILRIIPMAEFWPLRFLSLRGGYEYSHLDQSGTFTIGHGAVGGFTFKVGKFDINANITYRKKPARLLPGETVANMKLLIGLEYNPGWINR
jgi:TolB-like protein